MAVLPFFFCPVSFLRVHSSCLPVLRATSVAPSQGSKLTRYCLCAVSKRNDSLGDEQSESIEDSNGTASKKTKQTTRRGRKKISIDTPEVNTLSANNGDQEEENGIPVASDKAPKNTKRSGRKKATSVLSTEEEGVKEKATKRRTRKRTHKLEEQTVTAEPDTLSLHLSPLNMEHEGEELLLKDDGNDISYTYSWPPLVCCFGAAQHDFVPSGRPANRLIDHEIHKSKRDMFWSPERFYRAPGGSSSRVAVALASLGGRVEFMGKLGNDNHGHNLLYYMNDNKVQTRSVKIDSTRSTAVSHMKILKRGGLRMSCVIPCAEDSLLSSEININVLKEAKMFYFNSSSLLHPSLRSTTMHAIKFSRKVGSVIFFDLNLPIPLWHSSKESKEFIQLAWNNADVIEVTRQELEFLCGIKPLEKFDTADNEKSKFVHYKQEVIMPLWHDNLKVLFVTNGTSKIHYYTAKDNGCVHGTEDPPLTPYTADMSVAGDAIVAALMRMLTVQPHLITDKSYLEHMIKYAINCGVIDQWSLARIRGFPPKQGMEIMPTETGELLSITEREHRTVMESVG